jgi:hypothetical protein
MSDGISEIMQPDDRLTIGRIVFGPSSEVSQAERIKKFMERFKGEVVVQQIAAPSCTPFDDALKAMYEAGKEAREKLIRNYLLVLAEGCKKHRAYRGILPPRVECEVCDEIRDSREMLIEFGVFEK